MNRGTYISGWKFDWTAAKKQYDAMIYADRIQAATAVADPGVVTCPCCGTYHWREFEVFECSRCGAEVTIGSKTTAKNPKYPEKIPPIVYPGMRVKAKKDIIRRSKVIVPNQMLGTVKEYFKPNDESFLAIEWDAASSWVYADWYLWSKFPPDEFECLY